MFYRGLRPLIELYYDMQKLRVATNNRVKRLLREEEIDDVDFKRLERTLGYALETEKKTLGEIRLAIKDEPLWTDWLVDVKGIGPALCGGILAWVEHPGRYDTVSKLWAYAGLHVVNGQAARRRKGQKANWNARLKTHAWKIGKQFVRTPQPSAYRELYVGFKEKEVAKNHPFTVKVEDSLGYKLVDAIDGVEGNISASRFKRLKKLTKTNGISEIEVVLTDGHVDARAVRKVAKLFLSHVWEVWRTLEGIPIRKTYVEEKLGHKGVIPPLVDDKKQGPREWIPPI